MTMQQFPEILQKWYTASLQAAKAPERQDQLKKELPPRMEAALHAAGAAHPPEEAAQIAVKSLGDPSQFAPPPPKPVSRKVCGILAAVSGTLALLCGALPIYRIFLSAQPVPSYLEGGQTPWAQLSVYGMQLCGMGLFVVAAAFFLYQALRKQKS